MAKTLERIGDHAAIIAHDLMKINGQSRTVEYLHGLSDTIIGLFNTATGSWFDHDMDKAESCLERIPEIVGTVKSTFRDVCGDNSGFPTDQIAGSTRRIVEYCADIAEQTIDVAME